MESDTDGSDSRGDGGERRRDDPDRLGRDSAQLVGQWEAWVRAHPVASVGVAFGVGFVVAGGLASRTSLRVLKFLGKHYLRSYVTSFLGEGARVLAGDARSTGWE